MPIRAARRAAEAGHVVLTGFFGETGTMISLGSTTLVRVGSFDQFVAKLKLPAP